MGVVTFNYATFIARYPEFTPVSEGLCQAYFDEATIFFRNDTCNPAFSAGLPVMTSLLNMLTAHIAWLNAPRDASGNPASSGSPASPLVGRISNASEGSVNVTTEYDASGSPSQAWFVQTRYGAEYWQASAAFRTARYRANPTYIPSGAYPSWGVGRGGAWRR